MIEISSPIIQAISIGFYLAALLWIKFKTGKRSRSEKKKYVLKLLVTTAIAGGVAYGLFEWFDVHPKTINYISIILSSSTVARLIRVEYGKATSLRSLNLFSLVDLPVFSLLYILFIVWLHAVHQSGLLSFGNIFCFPLLYVIFCFYGIVNACRFFPERVKLAAWRLNAYAFPEGGAHNKYTVLKKKETSLHIGDILGWVLFLVIVFLFGLLGFWLTNFPIVTCIYFAIVISVCIWFIASGRLSKKNTDTPQLLQGIILGTAMIVLQLSFFWILMKAGVELNSRLFRIFLAVPFALPVALWAVNSVVEWPEKIWKFIKTKAARSPSLVVIGTLSFSIRHSVFSKKDVRDLQAFVIGLVFFFYYVVPKTAPLLNFIGIKTVAGKTVAEWFIEFEDLVFNWSLPRTFSNKELLSFLFGNQGLVLMFVLWALITLLYWKDIPERLDNVPGLYKNKLVKNLMGLHLVPFFLYFCPFLLTLFFLLPIIGAQLLGYSLAIILGVFTFGAVFIRLESLLLSLAYLVITIFNTDYNTHAVDINSASQSELIKLPGIGTKLAEEIYKRQPIKSIRDLESINRIGDETLVKLEPLIRISPQVFQGEG